MKPKGKFGTPSHSEYKDYTPPTVDEIAQKMAMVSIEDEKAMRNLQRALEITHKSTPNREREV